MKYAYIEESARKYHYWRGFRSACVMLAPFLLALMFAINVLIDAMQAR